MAAATATTQLNVRMESDLKASGDAVMLDHGISPSHMVRSVWKAVAQGGDALKRVMEVLEDNSNHDSSQVPASDSSGATTRATQLFAEGCARLGISDAAYVPGTRTWREMREGAIEERLSERGVL